MSKDVREHGPVVSVPVALKTLFRIVPLLQPEEFCELRIAAFQITNAIQKMRVKTGPPANGKGRNCMICWIVTLGVSSSNRPLANRTVGRLLSWKLFWGNRDEFAESPTTWF